MRLIDADVLEKEGWYLSRNYHQDLQCVYETKRISDVPFIDIPTNKALIVSDDGEVLELKGIKI